jgi:hypothetical protein
MPSNPPVHFSTQQGAGQGPIPSDLGYSAWAHDPSTLIVGGTAQAAGTLLLRRFSIPGVLSITSIVVNIDTAGTVLTAAQNFAGVWDQTGALIGMTADQAAAWAGTGQINMPLAANAALALPGPPFIVDTPYIYVGTCWNGTTAPFFSRGYANSSIFNGNPSLTAAQGRCVSANTGLTTIGTAPLTLGALTKSTPPFWCAVI